MIRFRHMEATLVVRPREVWQLAVGGRRFNGVIALKATKGGLLGHGDAMQRGFMGFRSTIPSRLGLKVRREQWRVDKQVVAQPLDHLSVAKLDC